MLNVTRALPGRYGDKCSAVEQCIEGLRLEVEVVSAEYRNRSCLRAVAKQLSGGIGVECEFLLTEERLNRRRRQLYADDIDALIRKPDEIVRLSTEGHKYAAILGQFWPMLLKIGIAVGLVPADTSLFPAFKPRFGHVAEFNPD